MAFDDILDIMLLAAQKGHKQKAVIHTTIRDYTEKVVCDPQTKSFVSGQNLNSPSHILPQFFHTSNAF